MLKIENMSVTRGNKDNGFMVTLPQLQLNDGEVVAIHGISGCGKSTLLEMIGCILQPDSLDQFELGTRQEQQDLLEPITKQQHKILAGIRAKNLGFMLQTGGLLPFLTVQQNIDLPNQILASEPDKAWIADIVAELKLNKLLDQFPKQLSIGERQRAAFVRSISHKPALLLADEPTAALDPNNSNILFDLIIRTVKEYKISAIIVTHDWDLIKGKGIEIISANLLNDKQSVFAKLQ